MAEIRSLEAIDSNLERLCQSRARAVENRANCARIAEDAERRGLQADAHIMLCDQRITELLDERIKARC